MCISGGTTWAKSRGPDTIGAADGRRRARRSRTTGLLAVATVAAGLVAAGCVPMTPPAPPSPIAFIEHVVGALPGAAFLNTADLSGDARPEILASGFLNAAGGPGYVRIYSQGTGLDDWNATDVATPADGIKYPNKASAADIDGDGDLDVFVPGGFFTCEFTGTPCGTLQWFENTGGPWVRHNMVTPNSARFYHAVEFTDIDLDGIKDAVTVGETSSSARAEWFKGTATADRFETTPRTIGNGGGALPLVDDVDGDGDDDVISAEYFTNARSFVWFERVADPAPLTPDGTWATHTIATAVGGGFQVIPVDDLFGDGQRQWVGTNHVNSIFNGGIPVEGAYLLDPGIDPTQTWSTSLLSSGIVARPSGPGSLAPGGVGAGDIDGDGDVDLAVSGDGDESVFWLEQQPDHSFTTYALDTAMGQAGGPLVADLDQDGDVEVTFSSYEQGKVVVYQRP